MSVVSEQFREAVVKRAGNRCEYCQLPAQLQISGFEIDHIFPRSRDGQTELSKWKSSGSSWRRVEGRSNLAVSKHRKSDTPGNKPKG
jgi:hypothetical protein